MGWQSYCVIYDTRAEAEKIIATINEHNVLANTIPVEGEEETGEAIMAINFAKVIRPYNYSPTKANYENCYKRWMGKFVCMFGIQGGRSCTEKFFNKRGVNILCYEQVSKARFEGQTKWISVDNKAGEGVIPADTIDKVPYAPAEAPAPPPAN